MKKQVQFYTINTLTNLHAGSGETNFGVIDNLVQKDVNTHLPTIHSSSLKGALKEYFNEHDQSVLEVFGDDTKAGSWQFLSADLLSRPVRSDNAPYFNATLPVILQILVKKIEQLGLKPPKELIGLSNLTVEKNKPQVLIQGYENAIIEELDWKTVKVEGATLELVSDWITAVLGEKIVLINSDDFTELLLPVIARNHLEKGESKNLWYEEIVPYDSRFITAIVQVTQDDNEELVTSFNKGLEGFVQIGANASIGYGISKLTPLALERP
ncbi:type III-B CRISPR module RAMP protein Cmr4 [uncultured Cyclobacterium sp.]|uniref:type III-B CRISPR module RAMP protein Cmr4 n=1 Tax=uncultured Cyclobacterium sp. TaxID=453820 RepID=UPI0030EDDA67